MDKSKRLKISTRFKFDLPALLQLAEKLRQIPCSCDEFQEPLQGGLNCVIILTFEDGVEWIFRFPHTNCGVSKEFASLLLSSEVATLKYVKENSSIPVPAVFDYSPSHENAIGVPYILMSKAPGVCLQEYDWPWHTTSGPPSQSRWALDPRPLSEDGKAKVMRQLGYLAHELSKLRFDKIGSLFEDAEKGGYVVKECLAPAFVWEDRDTLDLNRGPFDEELAYYESLTASTKMQAEYLPMSPHLFLGPVPHPDDYSCWTSFTLAHDRWNDFATIGKRIDSGENRVDYWIASDMANEMMRQTFPKEETTVPSRGFPLRHPDLSRGNIFVDEDLNITCVIDWGFASTVPFPELLACFGMPNPRFLPDPPLIAAFRAGYEERLGRSIDPRFWEDTMKMWNFQRLVSMDSKHTYHHFAALYDLVHKPDEPVNVAALVRQQHASESSQELLKELSEDDEDRAKIAQAEKDYFDPRRGMVSREAIMRKMSVVAQLNPAMVVDKRLWHWIEEALDEEASDEEESRDSDTTKSDSKSSVSGSLESGSSDFEIPDSEIPEPESLDSKSADS